MKRHITIVLLFFGLLCLAVLLVSKDRAESSPSTEQGKREDILFLSDKKFIIEIASTPEAQVKGLSGRTSLPEGHGLLFWFKKDDLYPFWMPNMLFSIDIVWIDKDWNIVHIEEDISPETYPSTFSSSVPARYVLELPAGTVGRIGAKIGQKITLSDGNP